MNLAILLLGITSGFAMTVWLVATWNSIKLRDWQNVAGYITMTLTNAFSTTVLVLRIAGTVIPLPRGLTTFILIPIIGVPPLLLLLAWRKAEDLIVEQEHRD